MVRRESRHASRRSMACSGALMTDLLVAMSVLLVALLPLSYSIVSERRLARSLYLRAVSTELVDGEMEALAAGGWRAFAPGVHEYPVRAASVTNLPPGRFVLTITGRRLRLEWLPAVKRHGGPVAREVTLP